MITLKNVYKKYKTASRYALSDVSLTVSPGEFVYVQGRSGSGKSTLAKLLYAEELPTLGDVIVNGIKTTDLNQHNIHKLRQQIGVVFQDYKLLKHKTVYENVAYVLESLGYYGDEIKDTVLNALKLVELEHKQHVFPDKLSGGEQQRVAIARAIVKNPLLIVADEPTGNLDDKTAWGIMSLFEKISLNGTTIVMVTHNTNIINKLKHRTIHLSEGLLTRDIKDD